MRIAQISTLSAPVAEESGGSVEAWLWLLTRELLRRGHEVTIFGSADSNVPQGAKLVGTQPGPYGTNGAIYDWQVCEWQNLCRAVEHAGEFDVMHSHAYLWGLPLTTLSSTPIVHTTHIVPDDNTAKLYRAYPDAVVTSISQQQWSAYPDLAPATMIHHGVDIDKFPLNEQPSDYICYLGRFVPSKGPRHAISIAQQLGLKLLMAGPKSVHFREFIEPQIDGKNIQYLGFVRGADRARLLANARALIYPIQYAESFGLVLLESMLCGTPIAAMRLGAVSEIVDEGVTGYSATSLEELPTVLTKCFSLDRAAVRRRAQERFSVEVMAQKYEEVYMRCAKSRIAS